MPVPRRRIGLLVPPAALPRRLQGGPLSPSVASVACVRVVVPLGRPGESLASLAVATRTEGRQVLSPLPIPVARLPIDPSVRLRRNAAVRRRPPPVAPALARQEADVGRGIPLRTTAVHAASAAVPLHDGNMAIDVSAAPTTATAHRVMAIVIYSSAIPLVSRPVRLVLALPSPA